MKVLLLLFLLISTNCFCQHNLGRHYNRRYYTISDSLIITDTLKYVIRESPFKVVIEFYDSDNICNSISLRYRDEEVSEGLIKEFCLYFPTTKSNIWRIPNGLIVYRNRVFYFIYKPNFQLK